MAWWWKTPLWARIFLGMALGIALGFALRPDAGITQALNLEPKAVADGLKLVGDTFVRLIRMLAAPLIFVSVAAAIVSLEDLRKLGSSGARIMALYLPSGFLAASVGLGLALALRPGALETALLPASAPPAQPPLTAQDVINQIVPANPVQALANGDMLSLIFFAILFGIGMLGAREAAKPVADALDGAAQALTKLAGYIMELAPIGAFALMAWVVATIGAGALVSLVKLVGVVYLGCLIYGVGVYGAFVRFGLNLPVLPFFKGLAPALATAYATSSSNAALPVTLACMQDRLGVSRRMASFVASLGATVNMDGTALHIAAVAVFGAQIFGVPLDAGDYAALILTATLGAIGAAGIPGGSLVFIPITLTAIGVPLETIAIYVGVDRLMDMMRTTVNVAGDSAAAVAVAKWEGDLDLDAYRENRPQQTQTVAQA